MSGIYIHIPFCRQACNYCNFHFATSLTKKDRLLSAIQKEIILTAAKEPQVIETIYFGGGTPSLLPATDIVSVLDTIHNQYRVDSEAEITLEANPDDIVVDKLKAWQQAGINRLSMGIQSFFEEDLQWMNRAHNAQQAAAGLELALKYFSNITIDLIYGTPGLTDEKWHENVQKAIAYGVPHLSCYALTIEPQTPLDKQIRQHKKADIDPEVQSRQFLLLMEWLRSAGYEHYEISNFARPGNRSRHNSSYWQGKPYLGIGPSAHSYNGSERRWNPANNQQYIDALNQNRLPFEMETLTPVQQLNETIMISLRTMEGLDLSRFSAREREAINHTSEKYLEREWLLLQGERLVLTDAGKLYADGIAADLFF